MVLGYSMSLQSKKKELLKLIDYGEENNFNKELIAGYKSQLDEINKKLKEQKAERERFKLSVAEESR